MVDEISDVAVIALLILQKVGCAITEFANEGKDRLWVCQLV